MTFAMGDAINNVSRWPLASCLYINVYTIACAVFVILDATGDF